MKIKQQQKPSKTKSAKIVFRLETQGSYEIVTFKKGFFFKYKFELVEMA